jgi:hypothetical protein
LRKKKVFLIRYAAAIVLLIIAAVQFGLVKTLHISPWKGGGFGMFSTVGSQNSYFIRVYTNSPSGEKIRIFIPEKLGAEEQEIFYLPVRNNFIKFKKDVLKEKWVIGNNKIIELDSVDTCCSNQYKPITIIDVTIELWQYKFNINTSKVYSTLLSEY